MTPTRAVAFLLVIVASQACAQSSPSLPTPTGAYRVGRISFHWPESKRPDPRDILAYLWYPAARAGGPSAPYLPGVERLLSSAAAGPLAREFGPSWDSIASNGLRTHSFENVPVASGGKLPILVFSPGGGATVFAYTTQMEELASQGYVVAGIEHAYDAPGIVLPDGRVVTASNEFWARRPHNTADPDGLEKSIVETRATDVMLVIGKLEELERDRASLFFSRLDLNRIGVFGHSRGGRAAARVCQLDKRVKACLNQDGTQAWQPFWLDQSGRSMDQAFMMLDHLDPEVPEEAFKEMKTTRELYAQERSARQAEARDKIYGTIRGGSYQVTIRTPGISHNSFSDVRLLGRPDTSGINLWPKDVQDKTPHGAILKLVTSYTQAFFDRHVRGVRAPLLDPQRKPDSNVDVRRYGAR